MKPYYSDESVTLYHGDALDVLRSLDADSVDAVVTDPPYGLEFMGREWDSFKPAAARLRTRVDQRTNPAEGKSTTTAPEAYVAGAPYQQWCQAWASECLRVLKPGGHLLAFGGTRTVHRLTCAIEDAGFEIRDGIDWIYGSGFPKSLDVSKAIDKAKRRDYVLAAIELGLSIPGNNLHDWTKAEHSPGDTWWEKFKARIPAEDWQRVERRVIGERTTGIGTGCGAVAYIGDSGNRDITAPATADARRWSGWGTALKPAREPIVVARKPLQGTVAANVLQHGTGALNIDACRVATSAADAKAMERANTPGSHRMKAGASPIGTFARSSGSGALDTTAGRWPTNVVLSHAATPDGVDLCGDGCVPGCPVAELDQQSGITTTGASPLRRNTALGVMNDDGWQPKATDGTRYTGEGGASRFFPVFRYEAKADANERPRVNGVAHPTVKPLALMRWLVRLVTPPGGVVLDPFAGSGTTAEACTVEGFRCVLVEREADYLPLIVARLSKPLQPVLFGEVS